MTETRLSTFDYLQAEVRRLEEKCAILAEALRRERTIAAETEGILEARVAQLQQERDALHDTLQQVKQLVHELAGRQDLLWLLDLLDAAREPPRIVE